MRKGFLSVAAATIIALWATTGYSQNEAADLVCRDIDNFKKYNCSCRTGMGILLLADHFGEDHADVSCDVTYHSKVQKMTVKAEVTSHADPPDAIKWLLHEVDNKFRSYYGTPDPRYIIKNIDGNTVYAFEFAGCNYRWISGNKVIMLEYHDSGMTKPEPMKIVSAYLAKHPSTLSTTTTSKLRSVSNETEWIKDEMSRRLWLCDKWLLNFSRKKAGEKQFHEKPVESMNVFLNYRQQYFGVKAADEKKLLAKYLISNNIARIRAKLTEYKDWWASNKDRALR